MAAIGNDTGVLIEDASGVIVSGNLVSGNTFGVSIVGTAASNNVVSGNLIGTAADGETDLGNTCRGVSVHYAAETLIGGTTEAERNVISGNGYEDVFLVDSRRTVVQGNYIGTNADGTDHVADDVRGVVGVHLVGDQDSQIGGTTPGAGNVISGQGTGIRLDTQSVGNRTVGTQIQGNIIGPTADGRHCPVLPTISDYWSVATWTPTTRRTRFMTC